MEEWKDGRKRDSRFTFHVSRFTLHVSRLTFHVSRLLASLVFGYTLFMLGCSEQKEISEEPKPATGTLEGNISPYDIYDAEIVLIQNGNPVARTGVDYGIFRFENVPPGIYDLQASAFGYVTNAALKNIRVKAGETIEVGRLVLYADATGQFVPTTLIGTVIDAQTQLPIAGAEAKVECLEGICGILEGESDANGRFSIPIWANLASRVTVRKDGYRSEAVEVGRILIGQTAQITVQMVPLGRGGK